MLTFEHGKGDRRREVEINDRLKAALVEYLRDLKEEQLFFNRKTGKPFLTFRTAYEAAVRRSGIGYCRFHDLRHTFASRLVRRGVDLVTVKDLLGHQDLETTLRYSHPGANARREAVALLSDGHHMDTTAAPMVSYEASKLLKTHNVRL